MMSNSNKKSGLSLLVSKTPMQSATMPRKKITVGKNVLLKMPLRFCTMCKSEEDILQFGEGKLRMENVGGLMTSK